MNEHSQRNSWTHLEKHSEKEVRKSYKFLIFFKREAKNYQNFKLLKELFAKPKLKILMFFMKASLRRDLISSKLK